MASPVYVKVERDHGDGKYYVLLCYTDSIEPDSTYTDVKAAEARADFLAKRYACEWGCNY